MKSLFFLFACFAIFSCSSSDEANEQPINEVMYFPPNDATTWETKTPGSLEWNENNVPALLDYLEQKNSKSFIVLHNGEIVMEYYFNGHTATTPWYWASAGKTLTTAVVGIAEQENFINTNNKVSDYIGTGWTSAPLAKENLITCKHLLSMTSGLDDSNGDGVAPSNLEYIADAGTRWAYHNVYVKLQDVVASATNQTWDTYFNTKLKNPIGMTGGWFQIESNRVYRSTTRSMARFGLLALNQGNWNGTQIVNSAYFNLSTNTSQNLNLAYGYMWWLNGKSSYRLPQTQFQFNGKLIPNAPNDMYCGLGKDDQKLYVIPSKKLVIIRMGDEADSATFGLSDFDNTLWGKINAVIN
ncbi:serine hydrolase domain-containing protein [Flavobacterium tibetense]|uniref:Serine hydrolase n=1 Tax=Flavobacterium tibetense TaxID=2233533 RepID=A0A365P2Q9_9FLAO|nr:serine hydrolase [Flavobacterium tibetense]RBA28822.1 serine hydrolase [Flavobacterium tibetense]